MYSSITSVHIYLTRSIIVWLYTAILEHAAAVALAANYNTTGLPNAWLSSTVAARSAAPHASLPRTARPKIFQPE